MTPVLAWTSLILNLIAIISFIAHMAVTHFKIRLLWADFARRKGLNGYAPQSLYAHASQTAEHALGQMAERQER